tara:strand:+ start:497 stop:691 length:195 start_codon:yes stop_codon:yes gene_type:complete
MQRDNQSENPASIRMIILGRDLLSLADQFVADKGFLVGDCRADLTQIVALQSEVIPGGGLYRAV